MGMREAADRPRRSALVYGTRYDVPVPGTQGYHGIGQEMSTYVRTWYTQELDTIYNSSMYVPVRCNNTPFSKLGTSKYLILRSSSK